MTREHTSHDANTLCRPIFILGAHKSGTSFLRSLLDGHPELAVLQKEAHYFQGAGFWTNYPLRTAERLHMDPSHLSMHNLLGMLERENQEGTSAFSDNPQFGGYDLDVAQRELVKLFSVGTEAERVSLYLKALLRAANGDQLDGSRRVVEKSVENVHFAVVLQLLFPDAFFLHIVREPYQTLASLRRSRGARYPYLLPLVSSLERSLLQLPCLGRVLPRYKILKYEDLMRDVPAAMREVAEFLEIEASDVLYEATTSGSKWIGNSTAKKRPSKSQSSTNASYKSSPNALEIHFVNQSMSELIELLDYKERVTRLSPWRRVSGEGLRTYVKNRAAYWSRV